METDNYINILSHLALKIASAETPKAVTEVVLRYLKTLLHNDIATVVLFDNMLDRLDICRTFGMTKKVRDWVLRRMPEHAVEVRKIITQNNMRPIDWVDISKEKNLFFNPGKMKSYAWVPLVVHNRPIGAIILGWKEFHECDKNTLKLFSIVGNLIGGELQKFQKSFQTISDQEQKISTLISEIEKNSYFHGISRYVISQDPKMKIIYETIMSVAETDATVLIEGETGTGKEIIAEYVHYLSPRKKGPFIKLNCNALPDALIESELFGHVKGAFTGAYTDRIGRFERARNGTLFLDEIGEMSTYMQVKLLRVLQEGIFERVGDSRPIDADVRIVCATNRDLIDAISRGKFRKDLYFRLNTIVMKIPPLRERLNDLPSLITHFIKKFNKKYNKTVEGVTAEAFEKLRDYFWPGNIRELEHLIERAVITTHTCDIRYIDLPENPNRQYQAPFSAGITNQITYLEAKNNFEREYISFLLRKNSGSITQSYREAGIDRKTFYLKMKKHNIKAGG